MTWTTYCPKHDTLELIDEVIETRPFLVERAGPLGPEKTGRMACEVRGVTDQGCKAHFIGGAKWNH
jgi:hypothetical protein